MAGGGWGRGRVSVGWREGAIERERTELLRMLELPNDHRRSSYCSTQVGSMAKSRKSETSISSTKSPDPLIHPPIRSQNTNPITFSNPSFLQSVCKILNSLCPSCIRVNGWCGCIRCYCCYFVRPNCCCSWNPMKGCYWRARFGKTRKCQISEDSLRLRERQEVL